MSKDFRVARVGLRDALPDLFGFSVPTFLLERHRFGSIGCRAFLCAQSGRQDQRGGEHAGGDERGVVQLSPRRYGIESIVQDFGTKCEARQACLPRFGLSEFGLEDELAAKLECAWIEERGDLAEVAVAERVADSVRFSVVEGVERLHAELYVGLFREGEGLVERRGEVRAVGAGEGILAPAAEALVGAACPC